MISKVDIKNLVTLARLEVSGEELAKLEREIPDILKFVETIQAVSAHLPAEASAQAGGYDEPQKVSRKTIASSPTLINIMRADENPHEGGIYTEALLKAAPTRAGNRIAVKQVIKRGTSH